MATNYKVLRDSMSPERRAANEAAAKDTKNVVDVDAYNHSSGRRNTESTDACVNG